MLSKLERWTFVLLPALALFALEAVRPIAISQSPVRLVVIVHPSVKEKSLDIDDLRTVFLRKRMQWSGGAQIVAINQPPSSVARVAFDAAVLNFKPDQVARYWIDARIRFGTRAPQTISGDGMVLKVIRALAGSIGYVSADQETTGVHIVARIEGREVREP
jgi:ABC-type phosphate transport system substrate-binding protein